MQAFGCPNFFKGGRSAHVRQTVRFAVLFVVHVIDPHLKIHPRHRSAPYTSLSLIPSLSHSPLSLLRLSPLSLPTFLPHPLSSYLLPTALEKCEVAPSRSGQRCRAPSWRPGGSCGGWPSGTTVLAPDERNCRFFLHWFLGPPTFMHLSS